MDPWDVIYYETEDGRCPGDEFLNACPSKVAAQFLAVLDDVAASPPPRYSDRDYTQIRRMGDEHRARFPRQVKSD